MFPMDASIRISAKQVPACTVIDDDIIDDVTGDDYALGIREKGGDGVFGEDEGSGLRVRCSTNPGSASPLSTLGADATRPAPGQTTGKSRANLDAIVGLIKEHGLTGGGVEREGRRAVFVLGNTGTLPGLCLSADVAVMCCDVLR